MNAGQYRLLATSAQFALPVIATLALSTALAFAGETEPSMTRKLGHGGKITCEPTGNFFCHNIHIGCSGRSSLDTFRFEVQVTGSDGHVRSGSDAHDIVEAYAGARVDRAAGDEYVILRPRGRDGYIKLQADGRYSFRYYLDGTGLMSHGRCH